MTRPPGPLDALAADILRRAGYRFTLATDPASREAAYRLRYEAVIHEGWARPEDLPDGLERVWGEPRAPVRFGGIDQGDVSAMSMSTGQSVPASTSEVFMPPKPNEFDKAGSDLTGRGES